MQQLRITTPSHTDWKTSLRSQTMQSMQNTAHRTRGICLICMFEMNEIKTKCGLQGDIWAETSFFGLRWKYLALMEGKVLDITEWANCQKGALSHLQPNSHVVQYRIVLGGQQQQQPHYQQEKDRLKRDQK